MNILILGASSQIGGELALLFSPHNALTLLGRNHGRLHSFAMQCAEAGAVSTDLIVQDISDEFDSLIKRLVDKQFDLVINLISATSRVKDSELLPGQLEAYLMSDLLRPVQLIEKLIENSCKPLKVIFISSVLASVRSPDRLLYGSLKLLQEISLHRLSAGHNGGGLLIVKVGKVISHEKSSDAAQKLATAIYKAHLLNKTKFSFGVGGRVYLLLYYFHPLIFRLIVKVQRKLRKH